MKKSFIIKSGLLLLSAFTTANVTAQETESSDENKSWIAPLQIRLGRNVNTGYSGGLNATGVTTTGEQNDNFRIGLGYSVKLSDRWMITPAVDIQGSYKNQHFAFTGASNPTNQSFRRSDNNFFAGEELIVSLPVSYAFYNRPKSVLSAVLGTEIKIGPSGTVTSSFTQGAPGSIINYSQTEQNNELRVALTTGLNYDIKLGRMPVRVQALYSHSLTDQASGSYTYSNEFTGDNQSGSFAFKGHQFTASLQFSPFGNGKSKKPGVEHVKRVRNTAIGSTRFGIRAGVDFNAIDAIDIVNDRESGFAGTYGYASLFADTRISKHWNLQTEFGLAFAGDSYFIAENGFIFKRRISEKFSVLGGPKLQYLIDAPDAVQANSKPVGLSLTAGLQYDISDRLSVEGRYSRGLTKQFNDPNFDFSNGRLNGFQLGVGFKF